MLANRVTTHIQYRFIKVKLATVKLSRRGQFGSNIIESFCPLLRGYLSEVVNVKFLEVVLECPLYRGN